jgi:hypothetical protein
MATAPAADRDAAIHPISAEFRNQEVENEYRLSQFSGDRRLARFLGWFSLVGVGVFAINDWRLHGPSQDLYSLLALRLLLTGAIGIGLLCLSRFRKPRTFDRWSLLLSALLGAVTVALVALRPTSSAFPLVLALLMPFAFYAVTPGSLRVGTAAAGVATIELILLLAIRGFPPDPVAPVSVIAFLVLPHILGYRLSRGMHVARRELFAVLRTEQLLRVRLESARNEATVLRKVLPICQHCRRLRVDGQWYDLEDYMARQHEAELSHGLCSSCAMEHYPEHFSQA